MNYETLFKAFDRGASMVMEIIMVILLAVLMPFILVAAVALALYGDITKKRNKWTGLEMEDKSRNLTP